MNMYDVIIIGSGMSSLIMALYMTGYYPNLSYAIVAKEMTPPRCTFGIFMEQIEGTWIFDHLDRERLFTRVLETEVSCLGELKNINKKYGIIDNDYFYETIVSKLKDRVDIISGKVSSVCRLNGLYIVGMKGNNILGRFVLEGTGKHGSIGIRREHPVSENWKQYFVGYKMEFATNHNIERCTLLDWYNPDPGDPIVSFGYTVPLSNTVLLVEETVLLARGDIPMRFALLEERLKKRIDYYQLRNYKILEKEIDWIPLNCGLPAPDSRSFGIGQAGNLINNLSGYTIGYNIYHAPEIAALIVDTGFNIAGVIRRYWNTKRRIINTINMVGLAVLDSLSQTEIAEFHRYYFRHIVPDSCHFRTMFLNCDTDCWNPVRVILSYIKYINFPVKYLGMIARKLLTETTQNKWINAVVDQDFSKTKNA